MDPDTTTAAGSVLRRIVEVSAGSLALLAHAKSLDAGDATLDIDGTLAIRLLDRCDRGPCRANCVKQRDWAVESCAGCLDAGIEMRAWIAARLAPPCTAGQLWDVWGLRSHYGHEIAAAVAETAGDMPALSVARAYEALAGVDRAEFASAIRGAPVPADQRALYEPACSRILDPIVSRGPRLVVYSPTKAIRLDAYLSARRDTDWLQYWRTQGWTGNSTKSAEGGEILARIEFDPAWPPGEIRSRARFVAAGMTERRRRDRTTLRRSLAVIARTRAAVAAALGRRAVVARVCVPVE